METAKLGSRLELLLIIGLVLLIRLPFLDQAIQGDDVYYLYGAQHALIDPAHPLHARYIFHGDLVDMRGHPHGPVNSYVLAGLLLLFGDVYEVPFHSLYILFSLIAAIAMWTLARRWSPAPLAATLLFLSVPAFLISGNSFEADLPFLAFWLAGISLFVHGRLVLATVALVIAALTAYQAVIATPILWVYCWFHSRRAKSMWIVALAPVIAVAAFQIYERLSGGALPATVLTGYFSRYGLQQVANKLKNAAALTAHAGWLVFPAAAALVARRWWAAGVAAGLAGIFIDAHPLFWLSFAVGAMLLVWCSFRRPDFLSLWVALFFCAALVIFFAGAARYLLPLAAPVAILVSQELRPRWLYAAAGLNLALGLALAAVNYQHWDGYRRFAESFNAVETAPRVWINGELGLRYYLESRGALPLPLNQGLQSGEWIVTSDLAFPIPVTGPISPVVEHVIQPSLPLRIMGLGTKSGYSTIAFGLRPYDVSAGPVDRVRASVVLERRPTLSWLPMGAPEAETQILSGIYQLEENARWMSGRGIVMLREPNEPKFLEVQLYLPEASPARGVRILLDGEVVHEATLPGPGLHTVRTPRVFKGSTITVELDHTFQVPGDHRELGAVLVALGFKES